MQTCLRQAAQAACECLIAHKITQLPVDVKQLLQLQAGVTLVSFSQAALRLGMTLDAFKWEVPSPIAFTLCEQSGSQRQHIVCYDESAPLPSRRFAMAHELAHILLGHTKEGSAEDRQANCFARHLLCPRPLLRRMAQLASPLPQPWLCQTFGLSPSALTMILCAASPLANDSPIEASLSLQLTQPLSLPNGWEMQKKLDPSIYLGTQNVK